MARRSESRSEGAGSGDADSATLSTDHVSRKQTATVISVDDLKEFQSSMGEEFIQFSIGGFFLSGSFWMGLERFFTDDKPVADVLFWFCVIAFLAGAAIGYFGWRQLKRRNTKIGRIVKEAEDAARLKAAVTSSTEPSMKAVK